MFRGSILDWLRLCRLSLGLQGIGKPVVMISACYTLKSLQGNYPKTLGDSPLKLFWLRYPRDL